jgi:glucokinase
MYILFDIGGTNMRLAASHDKKTFGEPIIIPTPKDFEDGIRVFNDLARKLAEGKPIKGAAGGVSASLSRDRRILLDAPHHYGWNGKPLADALERAIGAPVYLENDAAVVGLGEAAAGAGRGERIVAYITISTGVGGARIVDGKIDVSAMGFEPGHQIIDAGGALRENSVGGRGVDLEGLISGTALTERYGKKPYELTDEKFWDEMARLTAYGINNTIVHWSPDVVVLGGSMMKKIGIPVDRVEAYLRGILHIFPELPKIKKAELGDIGGLHGALAFLNYKHEKK